jgi:hypothetical protein
MMKIELNQAEWELINTLREETDGFRLTIIGSPDGTVDIEAQVEGVSGVGQGIDFASAWCDIVGRQFLREVAATRG